MKAYLLLLLMLWSPVALVQPRLAPPPAAAMQALLDSAGVPGLAVAVVGPQGVQWAAGYGAREAGQPGAVDANTVFSAASLSKPVLAYLVLKLVDEGKLDLDIPLHQYVPYRALAHDARYQRITARMVLSHQSGLPNWRAGQLNLVFAPGQRFGYSGEGFVYLQGVVTTLTGRELNELAQQYVFQPLGMTRTSYQWQPAFEANCARPHNRFGEPTALPRFPEANAAYSLQTTATDYGRFLSALLTGRGLKPATARALFEPQVRLGSSLADTLPTSPALAWGLGVGLLNTPNDRGFWHWGDNGDFRCFAYVSRKQRRGVVYFANSRLGLSLLSAVPARVLGQPQPEIARFLGYDAYPSAPVQVSRRLLKEGVAAVVPPFLAAPGPNRLPEADVQQLAEELSLGPHLPQALELLRQGLMAYPTSAELLRTYALATLRGADPAAATVALGRYLAVQPTDTTARHLLAQLTQPPTGNVTLRLSGFPAARLVTLAGSFNHWQPLHTLFRREGGVWRCTLALPPGRYAYRLVVDGTWQPDPQNPLTETDAEGRVNSVLVVGPAASPAP